MKVFYLLILCSVLFLGGCASNKKDVGDHKHDAHSDVYSELYNQSQDYDEYDSPNDYVAGGTYDEFMLTAGDKILFAFDSSSISHEYEEVLDAQIEWFKKNIDTNLVIEGHCDSRGTREYNIALGEKRANTVREYFISKGIEKGRIKVVSYGKDKPSVNGENDEAWRLNRRAVTRPVVN